MTFRGLVEGLRARADGEVTVGLTAVSLVSAAVERFPRYLRQVASLRKARETSWRAFWLGVIRYPVLAKRAIWVGSPAVVEGAERIEVQPGGSLRIGMGAFGMTSVHDTSVVRVRPGARFACEGVVSLQRGVRVVVDSGDLTIGHFTNVNGLTKILCAESVWIGRDCTLSWDVLVMDHDFHAITVDGVERPSTAPVIIGHHVWVGAGAKILKGVHVGDGSVIAAGAVVTRDVPPHSVAAGVPARVVGRADSWR